MARVNEEVALTVKNSADQRKLGTLTCQIKCQWGKPGEEWRSEVGGGEEELVYMCGR